MSAALVTGASGFIGQALCRRLHQDGWAVRRTVRDPQAPPLDGTATFRVEAIGPDTDWAAAVRGVDLVFHLAGLAHAVNGSEEELRRVNTQGTVHLARQAAAAGARRFVFVSSAKVNGERSEAAAPFTENDLAAPVDCYALAKWRAEQELEILARETGMQVTVVRPPLVYGPGVKANFLRLLQCVHSGCPLPLKWVENRRSLIYLENLVDALVACGAHANAGGQTFLVSDGEDVSTPQLIRRISDRMGKRPRLFPCPAPVLRAGASVLGKPWVADRVLDSLVVDSSRIRTELGWTPPYTLEQGLAETVDWFLATQLAAS